MIRPRMPAGRSLNNPDSFQTALNADQMGTMAKPPNVRRTSERPEAAGRPAGDRRTAD